MKLISRACLRPDSFKYVVLDNQIHSIRGVDSQGLVFQGERDLSTEPDAMPGELILETLFINKFEQPWPECPMHANGVANDGLNEGAADNRHRQSSQCKNRTGASDPTRQTSFARDAAVFSTPIRWTNEQKFQVIFWQF